MQFKLILTLSAFLVGMTAYNIALRNNNLQLMDELHKEKCEHQALKGTIAEGLCLERLELHNG